MILSSLSVVLFQSLSLEKVDSADGNSIYTSLLSRKRICKDLLRI